MGKYDGAMYSYLSDRTRFADFFNGAVFKGKKVLQPDMLEGDAERYVSEVSAEQLEVQDRFRDIKKRIRSGANFVILAIENQAVVDYIMPWRIMQYDQLEYGRQIKEICSRKAASRKKRGGKINRNTWRLGKNDKLIPTCTVCFYHGTKEWTGPKCLGDMMNFDGIEEEVQQLFHDYEMTLVCVDDLKDMSVFQTELRLLLQTLQFREDKEQLYNLFVQEDYASVTEDTARAIAIMTDSTEILERITEYEEGGEINMCRAMDELRKDWFSEGREEGREEGIRALITTCQELEAAYGFVEKTIKQKYNLDDAESREYMNLYWSTEF